MRSVCGGVRERFRDRISGVDEGRYGAIEGLRMMEKIGMKCRWVCDARLLSASHSELSPTLDQICSRNRTPSNLNPSLPSPLTRVTLLASHQEVSLGISPKRNDP